MVKTKRNHKSASNKKRLKKGIGIKTIFNQFSNYITHKAGSPLAFIIALLVVIIWAVTGPLFGFSDTWQLVINTGTTIITFLMVFLIQQSQNKDTIALQIKLDELLSTNDKASNRLVDVESLDEDDLQKLKTFYSGLKKDNKKEEVHKSHSIDKNEEERKSQKKNSHTNKKLSVKK